MSRLPLTWSLFQLTIVDREFVVPAAAEVPAKTADDPVGFALCLLNTVGQASKIFDHGELRRRTGLTAQRTDVTDRGLCLGAQIRVIDLICSRLRARATCEAEQVAERRARDERRAAASLTHALGPESICLDERNQRRRNVEVADEVDVIAIQLRDDLDLMAVGRSPRHCRR